jgi:hypothetical protein
MVVVPSLLIRAKVIKWLDALTKKTSTRTKANGCSSKS